MIKMSFSLSFLKWKMSCSFRFFISLMISIVACAFSTFAMCTTLPRVLSNHELQFDYIGAVIGVLSILVAVILGWNIYTAVETKSVVKRFSELESKIESHRIGLADSQNYAEAMFNFSNSAAAYSLGQDIDAIYQIVKSIYKCSSISSDYKREETDTFVFLLLRNWYDRLSKNGGRSSKNDIIPLERDKDYFNKIIGLLEKTRPIFTNSQINDDIKVLLDIMNEIKKNIGTKEAKDKVKSYRGKLNCKRMQNNESPD